MPQPALILIATTALSVASPRDLNQVEPACSRYDDLVGQLGTRYEEQPISLGLEANGNVLQIFASSRSGTWTILSTAPNGVACIVAAGESWQGMPAAKAEPKI